MKNILFTALFFIAIACNKDDSLDPRPDRISGQFVTLQIINARIDANNLATSSFKGIIDAPANNVDKYELFVARRDGFGAVSDFELLKTMTTFPSTFEVSAASIQAIGLGNLAEGDILRFYGKSYRNGVVCDFNNLAGVLRTSQAQKQGYKFYTDVTLQPDVAIDNQYKW